MSYCRFSTDSFDSDVYVYEDGHGFMTHIATHRYMNKNPRPIEPGVTNISIEELLKYNNDINKWVTHSKLVGIGLKFDGKTHCHETAKECADNLMRLRDMGYHVPQSAIDRLRAEENNEKNKS
jgi:hypothetical protein